MGDALEDPEAMKRRVCSSSCISLDFFFLSLLQKQNLLHSQLISKDASELDQ